MIRVGSQLTFCSPIKILQRAVVEQNEKNIVTHIYSLDDERVELSNSLFFDGILSADIVSLKQNISIKSISDRLKNYDYFDLSENIPLTAIDRTDKPLVIDVGTDSTDRINQILSALSYALPAYSVFEIIAACTFYPAMLLDRKAELEVARTTRLLLWENVDLFKKELTDKTCIREMS